MSETTLPLQNGTANAQASLINRIRLHIDAFLRRALDISASIFGLIFLAPFFWWIAVRIRRDSPGPIFYRGPRIGRSGKNFGILKFRTMYENPESYQGSPITGSGDRRITPFGAWLRNTKVNELPQLWNVLVGDMSLVGPRPEDPKIAESWPDSIRKEFLAVRPGVTSPATILYRDEESQLQNQHSVLDDYLREIMPSKLRLDMLYIQNRSFLSDLDVVFWTLVVLLPNMKRTPIPENRLYWGPVASFTTRYLSWFLIDSLVAFLAIALTGVIWRTGGPLDVGVLPSIIFALIMSICFSIINTLFGLSAVDWNRAPASDVINLTISTTLATLVLMFPVRLLQPRFQLLPDGLLLIAAFLSLVGFITARYRDRLLTGFATRWLTLRSGAGAIGERILLIGAGENSKIATWFLRQSKLSQAFTVVGIIDDDPRKMGVKLDGHRVIGTTQQIPALVKKHDIGIIFFTIHNISQDDYRRILKTCHTTETIVVILPDMLQTLQDRFSIANTTVDFHAADHPISPSDRIFQELTTLADEEKWDELKLRLVELQTKGATISGADRFH